MDGFIEQFRGTLIKEVKRQQFFIINFIVVLLIVVSETSTFDRRIPRRDRCPASAPNYDHVFVHEYRKLVGNRLIVYLSSISFLNGTNEACTNPNKLSNLYY